MVEIQSVFLETQSFMVEISHSQADFVGALEGGRGVLCPMSNLINSHVTCL